MKRTKRIMALLLAGAMAFGQVSAVALADSTPVNANGRITDTTQGTITITNAEDGETYNAYRILTLLSFDDDNVAASQHTGDKYSYAIKQDSAWLGFLDDGGTGAGYFDIDKTHTIVVSGTNGGTYYPVTIKDGGPFDVNTTVNEVTAVSDEVGRNSSIASGAKVQAFAQLAIAYAKGSNGVSADGGPATATNATVAFNNLPLGYYLVDSTLGSFVSLDTTNKSVDIIDKNDKPTIEKKVKARALESERRDNSTGAYDSSKTIWVENTDYDIGDEVTFRTVVTVKKGAINYRLHDVMEKGLTFSGATNVSVYATTDKTAVTKLVSVDAAADTYQVYDSSSNPGAPSDGCDFEVSFENSWLADLAYNASNEATIEVEYKAKLNKDAVVKGDTETASGTDTTISPAEGGDVSPSVTQIKRDNNTDGMNNNNTILSYGTGSSTVWDDATVETLQFDLVKTDVSNALLAAAKFELYTDDNGAKGTKVDFVAGTAETNALPYQKPDATQVSDTKVDLFTSTATQKLSFRGLEAGTYWLVETEAPLGYNAITSDIKVVLGADGNVTVTMPGDSALNAVSGIAALDTTSSPVKWSSAGVHVINKTGPELPSTGGIGTTVFYVVGGVLLAGSVVALITKRRMATES